MSRFLVRIELHNASSVDYSKLHDAMQKAGFSRNILSGDGVWYQLPSAEYHLVTTLDSKQVRDVAAAAALSTGKRSEVLCVECSSIAWSGFSVTR